LSHIRAASAFATQAASEFFNGIACSHPVGDIFGDTSD
jgi:hypothetical protein